MASDTTTNTSSSHQQDEAAGNDNTDTQYHHIDLPGQPVQLGGGNDHTILLRKHRDVVCDFKVGDGATYTIASPDDWFFDTRTKKRKQKAIFTDGERFHAWLPRGFKGELMLRSNKGERQRINVSELDPTDYGSDPKTKPAPIILQRRNPTVGAMVLAPIVVTPDDAVDDGVQAGSSVQDAVPQQAKNGAGPAATPPNGAPESPSVRQQASSSTSISFH